MRMKFQLSMLAMMAASRTRVAVARLSADVGRNNSTVLLPMGSDCFGDCQCESGNCYDYSYMWSPSQPGTCRCNYMTNEGCLEGYICSGVVEGDIALDPMCFLDVGTECDEESYWYDCFSEQATECQACATGNCHEGTCQCIAAGWHNFGCDNTHYCVGNGGFSGPLKCAPRKPVGSKCDENNFGFDCQSFNCLEGTCQCRPLREDSGCPRNQTCLGEDSSHPDWPGPFHCELRESIGSACTNFTDCESGNCFEGFCQCNTYNDFGCQDTENCAGASFSDDPWGWIGPFRCEAKNATGMACEQGGQCLSGWCVGGICQWANYSYSSCVEDVITTISEPEERVSPTSDPATVDPDRPSETPEPTNPPK